MGQFPTPLEPLTPVGSQIGLDQLYIKRDDLSGRDYGGNKVRKLEFLLAQALHAGAKDVLTMGFAGSNHALATALYARKLGLHCTSLLMPQVNAHYVRRNLLASLAVQADLRPCPNLPGIAWGILRRMIQGRLRDGVFPWWIPPGGSNPLGTIGYVNAALVLRDQIAAGAMPEPDVLYVPLGSMGTAVGLAVGLRAAGLKTRVMAVRVVEDRLASARGLRALFGRTCALLRQHVPTFPVMRDDVDRTLVIRDECFGPGYARFTAEGVQAAKLFHEKTGIVMNGAYSAKAFAALIADARHGALKSKVALFWNTYHSQDLSALTDSVDYHALPREFYRYFEQDVQAMDRDGIDR